MDTITTRSRKLEQFFYAHGVDFVESTKDDEDMTVWVYPATAENLRIVEEFRHGIACRTGKKGA